MIHIYFCVMKHLMYICVRLLLLLLFLNPYMGKEVQGKVEFNYLTSKDGLSNSQVNAISQDKEGFIWLATQSGLNRFDGFRIRTYLCDNMNNTSIPNNAVQDIQVDFQGNLWVQTSVGYCLFDSRKEVFIHDVTGWLKKYGIPGKPDKIYVDSKDNMWFVIYGVGCYFLDTSTKNTYFFKMGKDGAIPNLNVNCFAALAFLYFAASTVAGDDEDEEEKGGKSRIKFAPLAVFCTFFVAELGDKTQLTAITFGANEGMGSAFIVWIACSLGLFAADILGMLAGYLLKSKTPEGLLNTLAFGIFSVFGVYTLFQGLKLISADVCPIPVLPVLIAASVAFTVLCVCLFIRREKKAK